MIVFHVPYSLWGREQVTAPPLLDVLLSASFLLVFIKIKPLQHSMNTKMSM